MSVLINNIITNMRAVGLWKFWIVDIGLLITIITNYHVEKNSSCSNEFYGNMENVYRPKIETFTRRLIIYISSCLFLATSCLLLGAY